MDFDQLNRLQKFLDNRVDFDMFKKIMSEIYTGDDYIAELWGQFRANHVSFITSRSEKVFFEAISSHMDEIGYMS